MTDTPERAERRIEIGKLASDEQAGLFHQRIEQLSLLPIVHAAKILQPANQKHSVLNDWGVRILPAANIVGLSRAYALAPCTQVRVDLKCKCGKDQRPQQKCNAILPSQALLSAPIAMLCYPAFPTCSWFVQAQAAEELGCRVITEHEACIRACVQEGDSTPIDAFSRMRSASSVPNAFVAERERLKRTNDAARELCRRACSDEAAAVKRREAAEATLAHHRTPPHAQYVSLLYKALSTSNALRNHLG